MLSSWKNSIWLGRGESSFILEDRTCLVLERKEREAGLPLGVGMFGNNEREHRDSQRRALLLCTVHSPKAQALGRVSWKPLDEGWMGLSCKGDECM